MCVKRSSESAHATGTAEGFQVFGSGQPSFSHFLIFSLFRVGGLLQTMSFARDLSRSEKLELARLFSCLFEALNSILIPDDLDGVGLRLAARNELELSVLTEVLELLAGRPGDVHCLDVVGVEVVSRLGRRAGEFHAESAEVAQLNPVAAEELLAQAVYGVGQDALDGALRERRVVVCDVLAELVERELLVHLSRSVGHRAHGVVISLLGTGLLTCDVDTVVNHKAKVFFFVELRELMELSLTLFAGE